MKNNKGYFGEDWNGADWAYAIIGFIVFLAISISLQHFFGISKDWALAIILIPIAIFGYFYNKKKSGRGE